MTYEKFIARFEKAKPTARGAMVRCPAHEDGQASLSIGRSKDGGVVLKCFAGCETPDVVKALGLEMADLFAEKINGANGHVNGHSKPESIFKPKPVAKPTNNAPKVKPTIEKTYSYTDALGREVYQAVRLKPKSFRQRHGKDGSWIWNMDGVERVLYRLPAVMAAACIWIVEGEKDADNLSELGFCATCNVGGAGKWLDGYNDALAGKEVVVCGDNDEPGKKHVELVFESVSKKAKAVRLVSLPSNVKDVSDFIAAFKERAKAMLEEMAQTATPHVGGMSLPIYSMADIEPRYASQVRANQTHAVDLGLWLPSLKKLRPLPLGSLVLIVGDTAVGKTMLLQNIAMAFQHLKTLMFELELTDADLYERFMAIKGGFACSDVEAEYRNNPPFGEKALMQQFPNLFVCPKARLTVDEMESLIMRSELKLGEKPTLVLADYAQLFAGRGDRYQRASDNAEACKTVAKTTNTVLVIASQVNRVAGREGDVGLHDAKDSGSWENSAGLVLGATRDPDDHTLMFLKVLKATRGGAGIVVPCNIFGEKALINERVPASEP